MKAQSILGDIFMAFFFIVILISVIFVYLQYLPPEVTRVQEQKACAEAETLSKYLLEVAESDTLASSPLVISYYKFHNKNYTQIRNDVDPSSSFIIKYNIYAFNSSIEDNLSVIDPSSTNPDVYILRKTNQITIRAGTNTDESNFRIKLKFPQANITGVSNTSGVSYTYTNNTINLKGNISSTILPYTEINISLNSEPKVTYIKESTCYLDCPIYIGSNSSEVESKIGLEPMLFGLKQQCIIIRRGIIERGEEIFSSEFETKTW